METSRLTVFLAREAERSLVSPLKAQNPPTHPQRPPSSPSSQPARSSAKQSPHQKFSNGSVRKPVYSPPTHSFLLLSLSMFVLLSHELCLVSQCETCRTFPMTSRPTMTTCKTNSSSPWVRSEASVICFPTANCFLLRLTPIGRVHFLYVQSSRQTSPLSLTNFFLASHLSWNGR